MHDLTENQAHKPGKLRDKGGHRGQSHTLGECHCHGDEWSQGQREKTREERKKRGKKRKKGEREEGVESLDARLRAAKDPRRPEGLWRRGQTTPTQETRAQNQRGHPIRT